MVKCPWSFETTYIITYYIWFGFDNLLEVMVGPKRPCGKRAVPGASPQVISLNGVDLDK